MSDMLKLAASLDNHAAAIDRLIASQSGTSEEKAARKTRTPKPETIAGGAALEQQAVVPTSVTTVVAQPAAAVLAPTAAVVAPVASAPASAASAATSGGPTLQKVADAIIDLANTLGREVAVSVLTKYEAQKVPQLKPADFAAVLADVALVKAGSPLPPKTAGASAGLM